MTKQSYNYLFLPTYLVVRERNIPHAYGGTVTKKDKELSRLK
jgi:hypothetical protein